MHFRWKLLCSIAVCSLLTTGLALSVVYWKFRDMYYNEIRQKALAVTVTTAALLDGDEHQKIMQMDGPSAEKSKEYANVAASLRKVREANEKINLKLRYLYTLRSAAPTAKSGAKNSPNALQYVVDETDSNSEDFSHVGDYVKGSTKDKIQIDRPEADNEFSKDDFGEWLSASAPIAGPKTDATAAAVGIDIAASDVSAQLASVLQIAITGLSLSVVLSIAVAYVISTQVNRPLRRLQNAVETIGSGDLQTRVNFYKKDEFGQVGEAINRMADELAKKELLQTAFARYVSKQVMDYVLRSGELPDVKGERRRITVLFSDIRGFTTLSENMRAEDVVQLLNEYFERMIDVVFRHHGTLDKFIGDGMMVVFGAPFDDPYQEEHAIHAAIEMEKEVETLCARWELEGRKRIQIGIGISSGPAVVGNVGSHQRMEYTAIGDTVNLASRIESATKEHGVNILMSEHTYAAIKGTIPTVRIGDIAIRGREDNVTIYGVQTVT